MGATKNTFMEERQSDDIIKSPLPKRSIYNIELSHLQLMAEIENLDGEITPEISEQLELTQDEFETKAVSYGYVIRQYDFEIKQVQEEIQRLNAIMLRKTKTQAELKGRIYAAMIRFNVDKIEKNNLKLSFLKSKSLIIDEDAVIPSNYIITKEVETVDKKGLKEAILEGSVFQGIYVSENKNLQIR